MVNKNEIIQKQFFIGAAFQSSERKNFVEETIHRLYKSTNSSKRFWNALQFRQQNWKENEILENWSGVIAVNKLWKIALCS